MKYESVVAHGITLTFDEFRILLYNMGCSRIDGIRMPEKVFTEEEILKAMHHMESSGLIIAGSKSFAISEELKEILEIVAAPLSSFVFRPGAGRQDYYCYVAENTVITTEKRPYREDSIRLCRYEYQEFLTWKEQQEDDND